MHSIWDIFSVWLDTCHRGHLPPIKPLLIITRTFHELNLLKGNLFSAINLERTTLENPCNTFVSVSTSNLMGRVDLMNKSELNLNTSNFHSDLTRTNNEKIEFQA